MSVAFVGQRATITSCAALAVAASGEPEAPVIWTWYGLYLPPLFWTASCTGATTIAMSMMVDGPRAGADAVQSVFAAISCQSVTASARATSGQPSAPIKAVVPAATHLFQFQRVVMPCISLLPVWVERLRFTLRHDEDDRPFFRHSIGNASVAESDATQT